MSKRKELEAQRQQQQRKQLIQIAVIIGVIAIVLIGGAIALNAANPGAGGSTSTSSVPLPAAIGSTKALPPNIDTTLGMRAWGPANAPIKVEEYLDYQCPACGQFAKIYEPGVIEAFASSGKVRYEVQFMPFLEDRASSGQGRESRDAAQAAMCAADQGKFWQMHNTLFTNQLITGEENTGNFNKDRLKAMATTVNGLDTAAFGTCLDSNKHESEVLKIRADGEARGVQQTPTFFVNGKSYPGGRTADDFKKIFAEVAPDVKFP